jgi:UDP-N-acetylglucosamine--N-acetylmuramyl-(pentapeptide) pyrophosphoryl-undecaprenol N-acetylglucosamine transferase
MVIFLAAGGTGGHIIPAIAVADAIRARRPDCRIVFIGTGKEIERKLVGEAGYELASVELLPFSGKGLKGKLQLLLSLPKTAAAVGKLFDHHKPVAIAGFGGYPSFLPVLAAWLRRVPRVINEQNVKAGIANRFLSLVASAGFAVPGSMGFLSPQKIAFVPNPVRSRFFDVPEWRAPVGRKLKLLIVGGSQGAVSLNSAIAECSDTIRSLELEVIHQTGPKDLQRIEEKYSAAGLTSCKAISFIDDMASAYSAADIVICRAGAMTVAELCASGRAAIFVPLPIAGGHQAENARWLVDSGAALMLPQDQALAGNLAQLLKELCSNPDRVAELARKIRLAAVGAGERSSDIVAEKVLSLAG